MRFRVAVAVCVLLAFAPPARAAAPRPDLKTTAVAASSASVTAGGTLTARATVRNGGPGRAKRTRTGFYLSLDARRSADDLRLGSFVRTRALKRGKRVKLKRTARIPSALSGRLRLLACADVGNRVRERRETNNCRTAKKAVVVSPAPRAPAAIGGSVVAREDTPWVIILEATDPDTCDLGFAVTAPPAHGRLTLLTSRPCILGSDMATIVYTPARDFAGSDSLVFGVTDGSGGTSSARVSITVANVNDAPRIRASTGGVAFTEAAGPVLVDPGVTVSDPDDARLESARVAVTAGRQAGDTLTFTGRPGITGSVDANTGVLTLTGSAPVAAYQAALRSVRFNNARADLQNGTRTIAFTVNDGSATSTTAARGLTFAAVNTAPMLATSAGNATFTKGGPAVAVDPDIEVTDADNILSQATVAIGMVAPGDALAAAAPNGLTVAYDPITGTLTLSGTATVAQYEAALRSVTFSTSTDAPDGARTVTFMVRDPGDATSPSVSRDVMVMPASPPPPP